MKYNNYSFTRESSGYLDEGLRIYMLSIYKNMSMALGISGLVAYIIGSNTQIAMMLFSTPLAYAVMFAPLIYIFFFSRNLMSMDKQQAMLHLGIFAALNFRRLVHRGPERWSRPIPATSSPWSEETRQGVHQRLQRARDLRRRGVPMLPAVQWTRLLLR